MIVAVDAMHGNSVLRKPYQNKNSVKVHRVREEHFNYTLPSNCREQMQVERKTPSEAFEGLKRSLLAWPKRLALQVQHRSEQLRLALLEISEGRGDAESGSQAKSTKPSKI